MLSYILNMFKVPFVWGKGGGLSQAYRVVQVIAPGALRHWSTRQHPLYHILGFVLYCKVLFTIRSRQKF